MSCYKKVINKENYVLMSPLKIKPQTEQQTRVLAREGVEGRGRERAQGQDKTTTFLLDLRTS